MQINVSCVERESIKEAVEFGIQSRSLHWPEGRWWLLFKGTLGLVVTV